jgi:hypothetical protein
MKNKVQQQKHYVWKQQFKINPTNHPETLWRTKHFLLFVSEHSFSLKFIQQKNGIYTKLKNPHHQLYSLISNLNQPTANHLWKV